MFVYIILENTVLGENENIFILKYIRLPLIPLCPFILLPTEGETKARGRSGLRERRFSWTWGIGNSGGDIVTVSAQTASTIESMLEDLGSRLLIVSLLRKRNGLKCLIYS